jgi:hypothetical protein
MAGLVPGIYASLLKAVARWDDGVDGRDKPGHDEMW